MNNPTPQIFKALVLLSALVLAGCATAAKPMNMAAIDNSVVTIASTAPGYESVNVANVSGGSETNPLWTSEVSPTDFKLALEYSLTRRGYYSSDSEAPLRLNAHLEDLRQPMIGASLTVTSRVRYELENQSGEIVDQETITARHTTRFSEHLYAVERLRLANEGSIRENISQYMEHMQERLAAMY